MSQIYIYIYIYICVRVSLLLSKRRSGTNNTHPLLSLVKFKAIAPRVLWTEGPVEGQVMSSEVLSWGVFLFIFLVVVAQIRFLGFVNTFRF